MDYKLVEELTSKGFPAKSAWFGVEKDGSKFMIGAPSLSELIKECGDNLTNLTNFHSFWQTNFVDGMAGETAGKTPEEAVARFWLKMNS